MLESRRVAAVRILAGCFLAACNSSAPAAPKPAPAAKAEVAEAAAPGIKRYQVPVTMSQPSKGPADAIITIVEWCDLQGAACKDVEPIVRSVLAQYPAQARLVFRHWVDPTKTPEVEEFTRIAFEQGGKFWEARDLVMASTSVPTRADFEQYSKKLGLDWPAVRAALDEHAHASHVMADLRFGTLFDVYGVPAFFVNGRRLEGEATPAAFKALIDDEITRTNALVATGVSKDKVYAELTKDGVWQQPKPNPN